MENRIGKSYTARKSLFAKGLRDGRLTVQEIEEALPAGTLTAAERWLLYYSLRAAQVEIIDEVTGQVDHGCPSHGSTLDAQTPQPSTRISTCPGPGWGSGSSRRSVPATARSSCSGRSPTPSMRKLWQVGW